MEQEKSFINVKGKTQVGQTPTRSNTDVINDGGLSRSSEEVSVMGMEQRTEVIQTSLDLSTSSGGMNSSSKSKGVPISKQMIMDAYRKVLKNKGGGGVDKESLSDFEKKKSRNLYKVWNRLASGCYFPPAVLEVEIPKDDGKKRKLGIPTVSDRIAQQVVTTYLEPRMEQIFSNHSYGYRPNKNAHQALHEVQLNVRQYAWAIDMDIKAFFDNVSHELLMKALKRHVLEKWVLCYIERWLEAPIVDESGNVRYREGKGTPQGGVISPLLANLFLHYVFDMWMEKYHPASPFVRYADDLVIHCSMKWQADQLLEAVKARFLECGLEVHETKTKIAYCKNSKRRNQYPVMQFDFLGYTFKPRTTMNKEGVKFLSFSCAMSQKKMSKITKEIRLSKLHRKTERSLTEIANHYNSKIRGWINYYGKFRWYDMKRLFRCFNARLIKWASIRYKRFKKSKVKAGRWLRELAEQFPNTFYHWKFAIFRSA